MSALSNFGKFADLKQFGDDLVRSHDFIQFLQTVVEMGGKDAGGAQDCISCITNCVDYLNSEGESYTPSEFLIQYTEQIRLYKHSVKRLNKHVKNVQRAFNAIRKHNKFLQEKKHSYNIYFSQVKSGQNNQQMVQETTVKLTHSEMESKGLILWIAPEHESNARKFVTYSFRQTQPGKVELSAFAKKLFVTIAIVDEPVLISLDQLDEMENRYEDSFVVQRGLLTLNATLLKMFLEDAFPDYATN